MVIFLRDTWSGWPTPCRHCGNHALHALRSATEPQDSGAWAEDAMEQDGELQRHDYLLNQIYGAVGSERGEGWHDVLACLSRYTDSQTAVLEFAVAHQPAESRFIAAGARSDQGAIHEWENRDPDEIMTYALAPGQIMIRNNYETLGLPGRFQALLQKYSVSRSMTFALDTRDNQQFLFHAARSGLAPPYTADDVERVRIIAKHLSRAIRLHVDMVGATQFSDLVTDLITDLGIGLMLCDSDGGVRLLNQHADRIIGCDYFAIRNGLVTAEDRNAARKLQTLVQRALAKPLDEPASHIGTARFPSAWDDRTCNVGVKSLTVETAPFRLRRRYAALYLDDGMAATRNIQNALQQLFGLTPAEARIAERVIHGIELSAIPAELGVSRTTVRFHIEAIYDKLNVRTKGGMIATLTRTLPFLWDTASN